MLYHHATADLERLTRGSFWPHALMFTLYKQVQGGLAMSTLLYPEQASDTVMSANSIQCVTQLSVNAWTHETTTQVHLIILVSRPCMRPAG